MKKGIELSINFIVIIVIALVIFMFGVNFIYDLAKEATNLESVTINDLNRRIGELLCEGSDRVCIGIEKKSIPKGEYDIFGVKILNILDSGDFQVTITPSGYTTNSQPVVSDPEILNKIKVKHREDIFIDKFEDTTLGIGVEVEKDAPSGTYILDVNVLYIPDNTEYAGLQKLYVDVS